MIDLPDYELTDEESEALLLKSEHAFGPPLSPAARAVFDAFGKHPIDHDNPSCGILYGALPAALRAVANEICLRWAEQQHPADVLNAIAAELETLSNA